MLESCDLCHVNEMLQLAKLLQHTYRLAVTIIKSLK